MYHMSIDAILNIKNEILRTIKVSQNGPIADFINDNNNSNELYSLGLSFPRLKEIASRYERNQSLADSLWEIKSRESKIIATLLCEPDVIGNSTIADWVSSTENNEILNFIAFNLSAHIPKPYNLIKELFDINNIKISTFCTLTSIHTIRVKSLSGKDVEDIYHLMIPAIKHNDVKLLLEMMKLIGLCCRKNEKIKAIVKENISTWKQSDNKYLVSLIPDLEFEINFTS